MRNLFRKQIDTFVSPMFDHSIKEVDEYILKVELSGVPFKVCREIAVPSDIYAGYLAELLVLSVGWCGTHMHEILKDGIRYQRQSEIDRYIDEFSFSSENFRNSFNHTLGELLRVPGDSFNLRYDFGDDWMHVVTLVEKKKYDSVSYDDPGVEVLAGEGNCPPDDCGGVPGYMHLLEVIADSSNEEYEMMKEWLECWGYADFDPEQFNLCECRRRVDDYQRLIEEVRQGFFARF